MGPQPPSCYLPVCAAPDASNPVDVAWGGSRPSAPSAPVRVHPLAYAGESVSAKIDRIKQEVRGDR
jgi:Xaa-Pro aminopeptidase